MTLLHRRQLAKLRLRLRQLDERQRDTQRQKQEHVCVYVCIFMCA